MTQLSLFDDIDQEQLQLEAEKTAEMQKRQEQNSLPKQCEHCGEWEPNKYLWDINHGTPNFYDMPGACVKHWGMFNQARWAWGNEARQWLTERGFAIPSKEESWEK